MARELLDGPGRVHAVMELFSMSRAKDTMAAGCSGGERKRLTTVEMLQGRHQVLFMDEISTGLVRWFPDCRFPVVFVFSPGSLIS